MLKFIIMDYSDGSLEVCPVPDDIANAIENGQIETESYLEELGYRLSNIHYMSVWDYAPVYWRNESIPIVSL